jgi:hypothetical protein
MPLSWYSPSRQITGPVVGTFLRSPQPNKRTYARALGNHTIVVRS